MKEVDRKKTPNTNRTKRSGKTEKRDLKPNQGNPGKTLNGKDAQSKASSAKLVSRNLVSDSNTGTEPSEVYENVVIHYVDDVNRSEVAVQDPKANEIISKEVMDEVIDGNSTDLDRDSKQGKEEVSDSETNKDSVSSQGDSVTTEDEKVEEIVSRVPESISKKNLKENSSDGSKERSVQPKATPRKATSPNNRPSRDTPRSSSQNNSKNLEVAPDSTSESSERVDDRLVVEINGNRALNETSHGSQSISDDNGTVGAEENGEQENEAALEKKIEEMEMRIEKLEEELREVAALEISLYSVVPEHGSSAHKVHTPARRLSRLYIHACKYWTQHKRATIAKNTVSGLLLIAKSCGNDVPRLTFWLSNTVVLREIISQAFGGSRHSSPATRSVESKSEMKSTTLKWKGSPGTKQINGFMPFVDDWQETGTFTAALEKVESWIFSRVVESVWWQALTPHMQSPIEGLSDNKTIGRLLGPALGDQKQGSFSINLWKNAFQDAAQRLCPVRAGGHECGCLPVLARMVMEQCIARLDMAMFNAILRESAHEIPTDPVSDPIVDSKVLPIPAGDLSFGSGAQLKNSVGNWSRWLTDMFGMDADDAPPEDEHCSEDHDKQRGDREPKSFLLLNALSDLLMLPKDMLMDRSIRKEVCPSISLPLIKRILCNFTPDEFCPDPVPGSVLEALNAETIVERRLSGDTMRNFPYTVAPVVYTPPSTTDVAEKCEVADAGGRSEMARNVSSIHRKGYTSDEELEELESPLTSIIDKLPSSPNLMTNGNGNGKHKDNTGYACVNERYELLSEVWSV
ncbi:nucleolar protein gar2-like protein [Trema orientale]|uniref:Nucleolar protein gar2-like protein n=1 Tax=Trema orientale TaxID=63057 RepID=A0A2P5F1J9_TREOI|nr:nucleolar protein gar2-like protein [Trema orientale]